MAADLSGKQRSRIDRTVESIFLQDGRELRYRLLFSPPRISPSPARLTANFFAVATRLADPVFTHDRRHARFNARDARPAMRGVTDSCACAISSPVHKRRVARRALTPRSVFSRGLVVASRGCICDVIVVVLFVINYAPVL